jgi:hypothetical protein
VFQQLRPDLPQPPKVPIASLDVSQPLYPQIFNAGDLANLTPQERQILEMAVSCEVSNFNFYDHLQTIKDLAYEAFEALTGQRPRGSDTMYSPFNLQSPAHFLVDPDSLWPNP